MSTEDMYDRRIYDAKINKLEIELSAIKEKVSFFSVIYQKFDDTLKKVEKIMEDRRNETNQDLKDVYSKIQDTESKIMEEIHLLREDMKKQHEEERKKVADLDKWRWMVVGAAMVIGWIASTVLK